VHILPCLTPPGKERRKKKRKKERGVVSHGCPVWTRTSRYARSTRGQTDSIECTHACRTWRTKGREKREKERDTHRRQLVDVSAAFGSACCAPDHLVAYHGSSKKKKEEKKEGRGQPARSCRMFTWSAGTRRTAGSSGKKKEEPTLVLRLTGITGPTAPEESRWPSVRRERKGVGLRVFIIYLSIWVASRGKEG